MIEGIVTHLPGFMDAIGVVINADGRRVYERVFASTFNPWMRLTDPRALTITHGDAYSWNFLFPRAGSGDAFLIDWQLWHVDVGARDLAFLMALHWYPSRRRELEMLLIRRYLQAGIMQGGLMTANREGTPQGGPLSPLLSNIVLDDLDKELERRGLWFGRYADDCNIHVRSRRAGPRVLVSVSNFLERRLRLKVNWEKSAVARPWQRKFLGYSMTSHIRPRLKVAENR